MKKNHDWINFPHFIFVDLIELNQSKVFDGKYND